MLKMDASVNDFSLFLSDSSGFLLPASFACLFLDIASLHWNGVENVSFRRSKKKKSRLHANIDQSWIKRSYIIFQSLLDLQGYKQGE